MGVTPEILAHVRLRAFEVLGGFTVRDEAGKPTPTSMCVRAEWAEELADWALGKFSANPAPVMTDADLGLTPPHTAEDAA